MVTVSLQVRSRWRAHAPDDFLPVPRTELLRSIIAADPQNTVDILSQFRASQIRSASQIGRPKTPELDEIHKVRQAFTLITGSASFVNPVGTSESPTALFLSYPPRESATPSTPSMFDADIPSLLDSGCWTAQLLRAQGWDNSETFIADVWPANIPIPYKSTKRPKEFFIRHLKTRHQDRLKIRKQDGDGDQSSARASCPATLYD